MTVYFIGAGPGAPDLITLRGQRLIERCPVCLYAGSLVPAEIVAAAPANALVRDTAPMHLDDIIAEIAAAGELGVIHASAKTTRGCLSTDDGWISSLLAAYAATGELRSVFVEVFHHEDPALAGLRDLDPGHGIDTRDGRSYTQTTIDGLTDVARRLNNLAARGILKA